MAYRVRLLPRAESDLHGLFQYLIENAPWQGAEWFNGLEEAIRSLRDYPERCRVVSGISTAAHPVRQLLYGNKPHVYKVYFHILGETVEILHIRHGARKSPKGPGIAKDE
jgi:plasmid stabilization system protein ParE